MDMSRSKRQHILDTSDSNKDNPKPVADIALTLITPTNRREGGERLRRKKGENLDFSPICTSLLVLLFFENRTPCVVMDDICIFFWQKLSTFLDYGSQWLKGQRSICRKASTTCNFSIIMKCYDFSSGKKKKRLSTCRRLELSNCS